MEKGDLQGGRLQDNHKGQMFPDSMILERKDFPRRLLIVEDDPSLQTYLRDLFQIKGFSVQTCTSAEEALRILQESYYPVVLTDLRLPGASGMSLLERLQHWNPPVAVLVVTAYGSMESVIEALRRGAYDYILKPFSSGILLHRVTRALETVQLELERRRQQEEMASLLQVTRDLSSRIVYAVEEERRRISRELHDGVGQSLTIIKLTLRALEKKIPPGEAELLQEIQNLAAHVETTMEEVSRISRELNPSYIREVELPRALQLYLDTYAHKTGIQVHARIAPTLPSLGEEHQIPLYRIAQEALANVVKHARADRVEVVLAETPRGILLQVRDNGQGFSPQDERRRRGLGLIVMQERTSLLQGRFQLDSAPGRGTTITVEVPYGHVSQDSHTTNPPDSGASGGRSYPGTPGNPENP